MAPPAPIADLVERFARNRERTSTVAGAPRSVYTPAGRTA